MRAQQSQRRRFGVTTEGQEVECIEIAGAGDLRARVLTRGATLAALFAPDRDGRLADVVLGFDDLAGYERSRAYVGCLVGRVANRIARSRFELDGRGVELLANEGPHHLHGGPGGLHRVLFEVVELAADRLRLRTESPDGDQGYPGRLEVEVEYAFDADRVLRLALLARTDRATPVNLSHHAYWNLSGRPDAGVGDHRLESPAVSRLEVDAALLPTGRVLSVAGTAWDFRRGALLGPRIEAAGGFDAHLVLPPAGAPGPRPAATLHHPASGRRLDLDTTQPGFQLYTAGGLHEPRGKGGVAYGPGAGVCLEPQHPPDAVNQPAFPSVVLRPGDTYRQESRFRFSAG